MLALLADGRWHTVHEVRLAVLSGYGGKVVSPEALLREGAALHRWNSCTSDDKNVMELKRAGAHYLAGRVVKDLARFGKVERDPPITVKLMGRTKETWKCRMAR